MTAMQFSNRTPNPLVLAVWQTPAPPAPLASVCWMRLPARPGATTVVQWNDDLTVAVAFYRDGTSPSFTVSQQRPTSPGQAWDVVTADGTTLLVDAGSAPSENVVLVSNITAAPLHPGLAQSSAGMYFANNLAPGEEVALPVTRTMMAGLFAEIAPGEIIDPLALLAPPLSLLYPPGLTTATATAILQNTGLVLTVTYGP
jgi:hypothetical protein